jgi:hypothetical protein
MRGTTVGDMFGDITGEMTPGKFTRMSQMMLSPISMAHNVNRSPAFLGQRRKALQPMIDYVLGKMDTHDFMDKSGLWLLYDNVQNDILRKLHVPLLSEDLASARKYLDVLQKQTGPGAARRAAQISLAERRVAEQETLALKQLPQRAEQIAMEMAREYVHLTQFPFMRGTQPGLMRTGVGRLGGQFGVWTAAQTEFLRHAAKRAFQFEYKRNVLEMVALWLAGNWAVAETFKQGLGADVGKWMWASGMGYLQLGPAGQIMATIGRVAKADSEGQAARRALFEFPLTVVPGQAALRGWIDMISKNDYSLPRLLGLRPYEELETDQNLQEWLEEEFGYGPKRRPQ